MRKGWTPSCSAASHWPVHIQGGGTRVGISVATRNHVAVWASVGLGAERQSVEVTGPTISYRNHHPRRHHTDMDNIRDSLIGLKHDVKRLRELKRDITDLLERNKRKADKTWPDGQRSSPGPSARPESQVVTDGDLEREGNESDMDIENPGPSVTPDENKSHRKSTVSASAKLLLRGVRDSADAFGPLKSIAGGLCFILENGEVGLLPLYPAPNAHYPTAHEG